MSVESVKSTLQTVPAASKKDTVHTQLQRMVPQLAAAVPKHLDPNRVARIALTEFRKTPALAKCDTRSFLGAVMQSAQLGLEPGGLLGHCYLVPYKGQVQLLLGYRGMIDLARRSGQIISLTARAVFEGDEFSYQYGLEETLNHVPAEDADQRDDKLTHVYAVARLQGGGIQFEVLSRAQVEVVRKQSKTANVGPWQTHFVEMAKKTAIRRLFKYLPVSIEIQRAVSLDERAEAGIPQDNADVIDGEFESFGDGVQEQPESGANE